MKELIFTDVSQYKFRDVEPPHLENDDDVIIDIKEIGLCGTDLHIYRGERKVEYPHVSGHECVGIVKEIGDKVSDFKVGDYVTVEPNISCGNCIKCKAGRNNLCEKKDTMGLNIPGCFREMVKVPERNVWKLPESISMDEGVFIETATVALNGVKKANIKRKQEVVVLGAGSVGLLAMQLVKNIAGKVSIVDMEEKRLDLAAKLGADKTYNVKKNTPVKNKYDVVIDAAGVPGTVKSAVDLVTSGGKIVLVGIPGSAIEMDIMSIVRNEIEIYGSVACTTEFPEIINIIEEGKLKVEEFVTHKLPFTELIKGFTLMEKKEALKPIIVL